MNVRVEIGAARNWAVVAIMAIAGAMLAALLPFGAAAESGGAWTS